jgi:hypothetical protein
MKILLILAMIIGIHNTYAQDQTDNSQVVERAPENDGSTDRAPVDEGGGPGNSGDKKPNAFQVIADRATLERPFKVQIEKLKSLKLKDGKSVETSEILEVSLDEDKKIETVELKDNQIIHRLDVDTAVVKPNATLPHVVALAPEKVQFTVKDRPSLSSLPAMRRLYMRENSEISPSVADIYINGLEAIGGGSMMRVMGVDGGGRVWKDDTQSDATDNTPFRVRIGVDGGGITQ